MQKFLKSYDGLLFFATLAMFCQFLATVWENHADFNLFLSFNSLHLQREHIAVEGNCLSLSLSDRDSAHLLSCEISHVCKLRNLSPQCPLCISFMNHFQLSCLRITGIMYYKQWSENWHGWAFQKINPLKANVAY